MFFVDILFSLNNTDFREMLQWENFWQIFVRNQKKIFEKLRFHKNMTKKKQYDKDKVISPYVNCLNAKDFLLITAVAGFIIFYAKLLAGRQFYCV